MPLNQECTCHSCLARAEVLKAIETPRIPRLLLSVKETAIALSLSETTIRELAATGALPSLRIGTSVRIPMAALEEFADSDSGEGRRHDSAAV